MTKGPDTEFGEWAADLGDWEADQRVDAPAERRESMAKLLNVGNQILRVMFAAHNVIPGDAPVADLNIFHGDLQHFNVLVGGNNAMVIDWGGYATAMLAAGDADTKRRVVLSYQKQDVMMFTILFDKYPAVDDCELRPSCLLLAHVHTLSPQLRDRRSPNGRESRPSCIAQWVG